jgi:hypothetical protein
MMRELVLLALGLLLAGGAVVLAVVAIAIWRGR